ncbi:hypothetical protein [Blastopirellula retiformator]|uniref:Knr4/Smi1-like domain-containing protein n=1 Tax=Blastopirellula retiformator TaxID=2527970 RepID=A0A5C5VN59_9BACT|nr:hypothetical protein [Blastopirellula retiformator]TWT39335.1 hypothetical protein Enr8_10330 [Blastopirellula retiformator]
MPTIQQLQTTLQSLHGEALSLTPEPRESLAAAEAELGLTLPAALSDYYALCSHSDLPNQAHNRLLGPGELELREESLLFYVENQGVTVWGVLPEHLELDDPPVHAAFNDDQLEWELEDDLLSHFLLRMAYWQAVNGGLPNLGLGTATSETHQQAQEAWPLLLRDEVYRLSFYGGAGQVVCLFDQEEGSGEIQAATQTPQQMEAVNEVLKVEWDSVEMADD